ncbi:protein eyes shut homolog [Eublepharis macularius]|uniref:Protein eyes shut homolog n=1 Tax=Eublepharis macularius TaxID=481883 RepID=A0AA97KND9_EUBMA|nr:protein eyes shut homolog [Eublepharis macularius]
MCDAQVTILGVTAKRSMPRNDGLTFMQQETGPVFIGGLPHRYATKQVTEPVYNFTGCIEVTEINNLGPFTRSNAVDKNNIDSCRFPESEETSTVISGTVSKVSEVCESALPSPTQPALLSICQQNLCHNGGSCHQIDLPDGAASFQCDCPLHFTGRFCEKGN